MNDLKITNEISIPENELVWSFSPAGGPGGQHANRSSTRAELRFDIAASRAFDDETRRRILENTGSDPVISVRVDETRSQWRNRQIAGRRLADRIRNAMRPEVPRRRATRPSRAARRRRIDAKRARSRTKSLRKPPDPND